jgi:hypothetical protein
MTTIIQASVGTSNMQIEGTTALVTGANRGIGRAIAEALLDRGAAKVYARVRNPATVSAADRRLGAVPLDVTDADRITAVADELASSSSRARTSSASTSASSTPISRPPWPETGSRRPQWPPPRSTRSRPENPKRSSTSSAAGQGRPQR